MRSRLPSSWLSLSGAAAIAAATAAVLAGCGSIQAPGGAAGAGGATGANGATGPGGTAGARGASSTSGTASSTAGPTASASASGSGLAATPCAASGLQVRLDTAAAGVAAGSSYVPLEFTNTSGRACRLSGYPAVAFTSGASGQQIGTEAAVDRAVRASTVLLVPGGTAHAWLQVLNAANYPASKCHPVTAAGLRVVPPGTENASYLPHPVTACQAAIQGSEILTVHPVQQGPARRGTA